MLNTCFNNSPYQAINTAYPNKFKEWEFNLVPKNFWTTEKGAEATRWLIEGSNQNEKRRFYELV